jgi:RNA polymerase sigma-70 factor (ECF subfamily)
VPSPLTSRRVGELAQILSSGVPPALRPPPKALEPAVAKAIDRARAAWPDLDVDLPGFIAHVATYLDVGQANKDAAPDAERWDSALSGLALEDLYLAFACARGDDAALRAFERDLNRELIAAFDKLRLPPARRDDARQQIWEKLFVGAPRPRILDYSGRGRLRFWFRVTVLRSLLDDLRSEKRSRETSDEDVLLGAASADPDPELEHLKRLYRHQFNAVFEESIRALRPEDRNVLRNYYASKMTIDQIAAAFGIHRATAARRVNASREALLKETRRRLSERLALSSRELDSVFRLIESRLDISVGRLL